jgi:hypothetical protein
MQTSFDISPWTEAYHTACMNMHSVIQIEAIATERQYNNDPLRASILSGEYCAVPYLGYCHGLTWRLT